MDREMDSSERDVFGLEKGCEDHMNHQNSGITANQQFDNHSIRLVTGNTSIAISQGYQMDSFPSLWNHSTNPQDLNFCENSLQSTMSTSNNVSVGKLVPLSSKLEMDWNSLESISKGGGMFLQPGPGILPQNLSHFPADPRLIDPAVRLPCFNSGGFGGIINPFSTPESSSPYSIASKCITGASIHTSELNTEQAFKGVSMSIDRSSNTGTLTMNQKGNANLQINDNRAHDFSGGDQEESPDSANQSGNSCFRGMSAKKKKRSHQDMELDQVQRNPQLNNETTNENVGTNQKLELNNSTLETAKPNGKQAKESTEASKEDYIHMRARRGQATNSHSLAERVRRERISERMKYLQEIVPGCNKVTGKALMLDEIINYVQSLQRQVEFLSMKLAAVNPRLDFNIEGLLSKDLQSRGGSSMIGFSPDMTHALHPSQHGLVQSGLSGLMNPSDALRKAVHTQLTSMNGYKVPTPQTSNAWDNQLQSFFQMTFGANLPATTQELNGKLQGGFPL